MDVLPTDLPGVVVLEPHPFTDERGLFARTWDPEVMAAHGLDTRIAQCSTSWSATRGTLRGLHLQVAPHEEAKLVRCTAGAVWDVAVDLRPGSPTWGRWTAVELSADSRRAVYLPKGFAHGFVTLTDGAEVFYQISEPYRPESARGIRWDDPAIGVRWPLEPSVVSDKDRSWPALDAAGVPG